MKLLEFKVSNYKVFNTEFSVNLSNGNTSEGNFTILTGKNNMGKSTFLEAINEFFKPVGKTHAIPNDCYNDTSKEIVLSAEISIDQLNDVEIWNLLNKDTDSSEDTNSSEILTITKTYTIENAGSFTVNMNGTKIPSKQATSIGKLLSDEEPYYIRPDMSTEEINKLISIIYSDAISSNLTHSAADLTEVNNKIKTYIGNLKSSTDQLLNSVSDDVSTTLNDLFKNQNLTIKIDGSVPGDVSIKDLLKNTNTNIKIDSPSRKDMLLSEQGTGVKRMSLIYIIQNLIKKKIGNLGNRILLIDEPEAFLHPEAIRQLSSSLYEIGNYMPLIITTHSPILINLENDHTIIDIFKIDKTNSNATTLFSSHNTQFEADDRQNMKILNYVDSYVNEFFFSDKNIIVEGYTEKLVFQYIQKKYNLPFHIINARGKATVKTLMKILNQFGADYYVLHDVDNNPQLEQPTLIGQRTNCQNIFANKGKHSHVFGHNFTFEAAFYGNIEASNQKTKKIFDIMESTDADKENFAIKQDILATYNKLFNLGITEFDSCIPNQKVIEITSADTINDLFQPLIL